MFSFESFPPNVLIGMLPQDVLLWKCLIEHTCVLWTEQLFAVFHYSSRNMSDKVEINLSGVKQSKGVWLVKVSSPAQKMMDEWFIAHVTAKSPASTLISPGSQVFGSTMGQSLWEGRSGKTQHWKVRKLLYKMCFQLHLHQVTLCSCPPTRKQGRTEVSPLPVVLHHIVYVVVLFPASIFFLCSVLLFSIRLRVQHLLNIFSTIFNTIFAINCENYEQIT